MKTTALILSCLTLQHFAHAEPEPLTNGQAYLAATLAAFSTPKMKEAPIKVDAAIRKATGLQEDSGAKAIIAIPDGRIAELKLAELASGTLPLCRLWLKGYALILPESKKASVEKMDVDAEGETHRVNIWLLGVRKSDKGNPELIVCANQKEPVMVLPLTSLDTPAPADPDGPVRVGVQIEDRRTWLVLSMLGTHEAKLEIE